MKSFVSALHIAKDDDDPSNFSGTFLLYRKHSWREVRVNGNVCVEEHNFCFQCEKEQQREYCFV